MAHSFDANETASTLFVSIFLVCQALRVKAADDVLVEVEMYFTCTYVIYEVILWMNLAVKPSELRRRLIIYMHGFCCLILNAH